MTFEEAPPQDWVVIASGEIDLSTASRLRESLMEAVQAGHGHVIVDLADVTFMDSTGIGVLASTFTRLKAEGRDLAVRSASRPVSRVLAISGLDKVIRVEN